MATLTIGVGPHAVRLVPGTRYDAGEKTAPAEKFPNPSCKKILVVEPSAIAISRTPVPRKSPAPI